jgi:hypothetical protein
MENPKTHRPIARRSVFKYNGEIRVSMTLEILQEYSFAVENYGLVGVAPAGFL